MLRRGGVALGGVGGGGAGGSRPDGAGPPGACVGRGVVVRRGQGDRGGARVLRGVSGVGRDSGGLFSRLPGGF